MSRRTWEEIDLLVLRAINQLPKGKATSSALHGRVGTGVRKTHSGNTERLLQRVQRHGLIRQTYTLTWEMTEIGKEIYDEHLRARKLAKEAARKADRNLGAGPGLNGLPAEGSPVHHRDTHQ